MKKLKDNQKHGCDYCRTDGNKTQAVWRGQCFTGKFACDMHRESLREDENKSSIDANYSEADYQTWMRL